MTGYQEVLTDPSYAGQIIVMTFPLIGNTGINGYDHESEAPRATGLAVRRISRYTTNHRAEESLAGFLDRLELPAIEEIDTRAVTRHLRTRGAMRAVLATDERAELSDSELVRLAAATPGVVGIDLATGTSRGHLLKALADGRLVPVAGADPFAGGDGPRLAVVDFGAKAGIPRALAERGARVIVVPATISATDLLALAPDAVVLSNGPGDPAPVESGIELARALLGHLPILGICLGHQLLALALGLGIEKLHFGHRGANHPVLDVATGRVLVTSQNHGFAVVAPGQGMNGGGAAGEIEITHLSLFDSTIEGFRHRELRLSAVQFHPEASPGPHDASTIFDQFLADLSGVPCPAVMI
jgi:carbamoyl-phosphate synthase small subunit